MIKKLRNNNIKITTLPLRFIESHHRPNNSLNPLLASRNKESMSLLVLVPSSGVEKKFVLTKV